MQIIREIRFLNCINLVDSEIELRRELFGILQEINLDLVNRAVHRKHKNHSVTFLDIGIRRVRIFLMHGTDTRRIDKRQTLLQERGRTVQFHLRNA